MKHSFSSHSELAHAWVYQTSDEAHSSDRRMFFDGDTIYSYGRHYAIARIIGEKTVLLNKTNYSPSTCKHVGLVHWAIPGNWTVIRCSYPDAGARLNFDAWKDEIDSYEDSLNRATFPQKWLNKIQGAYSEAKRYAAAVGAKIPKEMTARVKKLEKRGEKEGWKQKWDAHLVKAQESLRKRRETAERKWRERQLAYEKAHIKSAREETRRFFEGKTNYVYTRLQMVRINSKGRFQTSRGVEIPYEIGKRFWEKLMANEITTESALMQYRVWNIDTAANEISIGCHTFRIPYLKSLGKRLFDVA